MKIHKCALYVVTPPDRFQRARAHISALDLKSGGTDCGSSIVSSLRTAKSEFRAGRRPVSARVGDYVDDVVPSVSGLVVKSISFFATHQPCVCFSLSNSHLFTRHCQNFGMVSWHENVFYPTESKKKTTKVYHDFIISNNFILTYIHT